MRRIFAVLVFAAASQPTPAAGATAPETPQGAAAAPQKNVIVFGDVSRFEHEFRELWLQRQQIEANVSHVTELKP